MSEREGREQAALDIEAEARAYEAQFGTTGPGSEAAAVLWMAAQIARGRHSDRESVQDCVDRGVPIPPGEYRLDSPIVLRADQALSGQ